MILEYGDKWSKHTSEAALNFLSTYHRARHSEPPPILMWRGGG